MSANPATLAARLQAAPRCHAHSKRTRLPCRAPAVRGFAVCRFHGARGGARRGNRNAWKHGVRGAAWAREAAGLRALVRGALRLVSAAKSRVHGVVRSNCAGGLPSPTLARAPLAPAQPVEAATTSWKKRNQDNVSCGTDPHHPDRLAGHRQNNDRAGLGAPDRRRSPAHRHDRTNAAERRPQGPHG